MVSTAPNSSANLSHVRQDIQALQTHLVEWRRQFHQKPELGFQEKLTADFISQKLQEWGIEHHTEIAKLIVILP